MQLLQIEISQYINALLSVENPVYFSILLLLLVVIVSFVFQKYILIPIKEEHYKEKLEIEKKSLKEFSRRLQQELENERKKIAMEIHDGVVQDLSIVKKELQDIQYDHIYRLLGNSIEELRTISHQLRPIILEEKGLKPALISLVDSVNTNHKLDGAVIIGEDIDRLDKNFESLIYRIVQESVNNIVKHSFASMYTIKLSIKNNMMNLIIDDDGEGFKTEELNEGIGLANIKDRVESRNGTLDINSSNESGTTLKIKIPVNNE